MNVKTKKAKNQVNVKNSSIKVLSNEEISRRIEKIEKNLTAHTWRDLETNGKFEKNDKLTFISDEMLIVGCDIGSEIHYVRAIDVRGRELSEEVFGFSNNEEGFESAKEYQKIGEIMKISSLKGCVVNNKIYFPVRNFNAVYAFDILKKKFEFVMEFKDEEITATDLYIGVESSGDELCFIPSKGKYIIFYNIKTEEYEKIGCPDEIKSNEYKVMDYIKVGSIIYLFPTQGNTLIQLNIETKEMKSIKMCQKSLLCYMPIIYNQYIVGIVKNQNKLLVFDLNALKIDFIEIKGREGKKISCIVSDEKDIYIYFLGERELIQVDSNFNMRERYEIGLENDELIRAVAEGQYLFFCGLENNIYCFNKDTKEFTLYISSDLEKNIWIDGLGSDGRGRLVKDCNKIYFLPGDYGSLYEIDSQSMDGMEYVATVDDLELLKKYWRKGISVEEKGELNLKLMIRSIVET